MTEAANEFRAPTDVLWSIVHGKISTITRGVDDYAAVAKQIYPGIDPWGSIDASELKLICSAFAKHDLAKALPELVDQPTPDAAIKALGETLPIKSIRPCKGYEWETWAA